ncbi:MAG: MFS transporter [Gemmatimonadales bacterium]|nr:MAG: MFS transporter [Gemmatimonadales bacterium]
MTARATPLTWLGIARLALVQVAIGSVMVIMTSTLNRVMVVELGLAASIPGALVALHFAVQLLRPRMGFLSDAGGKRISWIVGGMTVVALSGFAAAGATVLLGTHTGWGLALGVLSFIGLGVGISAASTPLLAYLAERVEEKRMAGAAALFWILMIAGMIVTAGVAGTLLDPFSPARLLAVTGGVCGIALLATLVAVWGRTDGIVVNAFRGTSTPDGRTASFGDTFRAMWEDPQSRRFAIFVFVSMLAYSAQEIILEPFAGEVFGMTPGESTRVAGMQHGGALLGMLIGAVGASRFGTLPRWAAAGCIGSAVALLALAFMPSLGSVGGMKISVFSLGVANGVFAVAAIGAMMGLTVRGKAGGAGLRMGFWGGAQALAYGTGGFMGAALSDLARAFLGSPSAGYVLVFLLEAVLFVAAAGIVLSVQGTSRTRGIAPIRRGIALSEPA